MDGLVQEAGVGDGVEAAAVRAAARRPVVQRGDARVVQGRERFMEPAIELLLDKRRELQIHVVGIQI